MDKICLGEGNNAFKIIITFSIGSVSMDKTQPSSATVPHSLVRLLCRSPALPICIEMNRNRHGDNHTRLPILSRNSTSILWKRIDWKAAKYFKLLFVLCSGYNSVWYVCTVRAEWLSPCESIQRNIKKDESHYNNKTLLSINIQLMF